MTEFRDELQAALNETLPGYTAQKRMAPSGRSILPPGNPGRKAAVAIVIYKDQNQNKKIVLIKRPVYSGPHSGQIAFPGGKMDPEDSDLVGTAIRECYEEIGIQLTASNYIGPLSQLHISVSSFLVHPYIFLLDLFPVFKPNEKEVIYLIHVALTDLLDEGLVKETLMGIRNEEIVVPYYDIQNEIVWGATAIMLAEFIAILKKIDTKNPGLI